MTATVIVRTGQYPVKVNAGSDEVEFIGEREFICHGEAGVTVQELQVAVEYPKWVNGVLYESAADYEGSLKPVEEPKPVETHDPQVMINQPSEPETLPVKEEASKEAEHGTVEG